MNQRGKFYYFTAIFRVFAFSLKEKIIGIFFSLERDLPGRNGAKTFETHWPRKQSWGEKEQRDRKRRKREGGGGARSQYCFVFYSRWLNVHIDCLIKIRRTIFLIAAFLKLE